MPKTTIKIDNQILEPWRDIAGILGMTLSDFLEGCLSQLADDLRALDNIGEEISDWPYQTREEHFSLPIRSQSRSTRDFRRRCLRIQPSTYQTWRPFLVWAVP
jgi:hypothetical protein